MVIQVWTTSSLKRDVPSTIIRVACGSKLDFTIQYDIQHIQGAALASPQNQVDTVCIVAASTDVATLVIDNAFRHSILAF